MKLTGDNNKQYEICRREEHGEGEKAKAIGAFKFNPILEEFGWHCYSILNFIRFVELQRNFYGRIENPLRELVVGSFR